MINGQWIATPPEQTNRVRLFCFPFAGGGSRYFNDWQQYFGPSVTVVPVLLPGRESRLGEPAHEHMEALIQDMVPALLPHLHQPFAFFGHSMGAKIAFELACALEEKSLPAPGWLFLSASRAPHIPEPQPIHHLAHDKFVSALRRFDGTPEEVLQNEDLLSIFLPLLRADFTLDETYARSKSGQRVRSSLHVFYGTEDNEAPEHEVLPWAAYTKARFSATALRGGHFFIKDHIEVLAASVCTAIAASRVRHADTVHVHP